MNMFRVQRIESAFRRSLPYQTSLHPSLEMSLTFVTSRKLGNVPYTALAAGTRQAVKVSPTFHGGGDPTGLCRADRPQPPAQPPQDPRLTMFAEALDGHHRQTATAWRVRKAAAKSVKIDMYMGAQIYIFVPYICSLPGDYVSLAGACISGRPGWGFFTLRWAERHAKGRPRANEHRHFEIDKREISA